MELNHYLKLRTQVILKTIMIQKVCWVFFWFLWGSLATWFLSCDVSFFLFKIALHFMNFFQSGAEPPCLSTNSADTRGRRTLRTRSQPTCTFFHTELSKMLQASYFFHFWKIRFCCHWYFDKVTWVHRTKLSIALAFVLAPNVLLWLQGNIKCFLKYE